MKDGLASTNEFGKNMLQNTQCSFLFWDLKAFHNFRQWCGFMFPRSRAWAWDPCVYDFEGRAVKRRELGRTRGAGDTAKQGCGLRWRQPQLKTMGVLEHALHTELGPPRWGTGLWYPSLSPSVTDYGLHFRRWMRVCNLLGGGPSQQKVILKTRVVVALLQPTFVRTGRWGPPPGRGIVLGLCVHDCAGPIECGWLSSFR